MIHLGSGSQPGEVHLQLLGGFRVSAESRAVDDGAWRWRKARAVVKLLGLTPGHRLHREQVLEHLWPGQTPEAAANNFYQALHYARRALEPLLSRRGSPWLRLQGDTLVLAPKGGLQVDADAFETAAATALRLRDTAALERAVQLYGGELLPEDRYEDWTAERREALGRIHLRLLAALAARYEGAGELVGAIETLEKVLAHEPAHEEAHVGLMRLYARTGQRSTALAQFDRMSERLRRDLGVEPGSASLALRQEILTGHPAREALPAMPGRLPVALTSFIGRARELAELKHLLGTTRFLTITGPGGGGKTRLALALAEAVQRDFSDGVWWVDLSALVDQAHVASAVAARLNVRVEPGQSLLDTLCAYIRTKNALIVFDTCEHLLEGCSRTVDALLRTAPTLRVVATSREPLGMQGEQIWRVPLMGLPAETQPSVEDCQRSEAIQLFAARAKSAYPGFALTASNAGAVANICHGVDGLPLAIELAAARVRHLSATEVLKRLNDRFRLLVGPRTSVGRHRTMRAVLDWSYELLSDAERAVLNRLSAFAGGFTLEAAQDVCAADGLDASDILEVLSRLVDRSMVTIEETPHGSIRYGLLDTTRQYAEERLREKPDEAAAARAKHRDFFLNLAERGHADAIGANQSLWEDRFERDHDNLRAAMDWSMHTANVEAALRLAAATSWFWEYHGYWQEGRARLDTALAASGNVSPAARARALGEAGRLAFYHADTTRAAALLGEASALFRTAGDTWGLCRTLFTLALLAGRQGDLANAIALHDESLLMARELANPSMMNNRLANLAGLTYLMGDYRRSAEFARECIALSHGDVERPARAAALRIEAGQAHRGGDYGLARRLYEDALALCRQMGERTIGIAWVLVDLAAPVREQGEYERAAAHCAEALDLSRRLAARTDVAAALDGLGTVARDVGDLRGAAASYEESHAIAEQLGYKPRIAFSAYHRGLLARYKGDLMSASHLLEESLRLRREMGAVVMVAWTLQALAAVACDGGDHERATALLRESLYLLRGGTGRLTAVRHLEAAAAAASGCGDPTRAVRLLACAAAARETMRTPLPPCDRSAYDRMLSRVRADLGEEAFSTAWAAGAVRSVERTVEEAFG